LPPTIESPTWSTTFPAIDEEAAVTPASAAGSSIAVARRSEAVPLGAAAGGAFAVGPAGAADAADAGPRSGVAADGDGDGGVREHAAIAAKAKPKTMGRIAPLMAERDRPVEISDPRAARGFEREL
jgi:hypothetical protein